MLKFTKIRKRVIRNSEIYFKKYQIKIPNPNLAPPKNKTLIQLSLTLSSSPSLPAPWLQPGSQGSPGVGGSGGGRILRPTTAHLPRHHEATRLTLHTPDQEGHATGRRQRGRPPRDQAGHIIAPVQPVFLCHYVERLSEDVTAKIEYLVVREKLLYRVLVVQVLSCYTVFFPCNRRTTKYLK